MAEFTKIKQAETGDPNAIVHMWDIFYYENLYKKEKFSVDAEQLRVFFPYEQTLQGMFRVYEEIFRLKIVEAKPDYKWNEKVTLHLVYDSLSGELLGALYLDMFPREGKFNHFAMFPLISGKRLPSGHYQRPTVALICNFPTPGKDKPSLLSHDNVETLFHEFGHALHGILTRTKFSRFAGTSVPRDFVEAPSQMLENWIWDKTVLDAFAADYRDPSVKIPQSVLDKLQEAKKATIARHYRRQLSYGLVDLGLHTLCGRGHRRRPGCAVAPDHRGRLHEAAGQHLVRWLLWSPDGLRRRLLRLCLGGCHLGGHGHGFRDGSESVLRQKGGHASAPRDLRGRRLPRRQRVDREIPRPPPLLKPFLNDLGIAE